MIDVEAVCEARRQAKARPFAATTTCCCWGDEPRQWLARYRSDRHGLECIARDARRTVAEVRAGIDRLLEQEGRTLAELEAGGFVGGCRCRA